MIVHCTCIATIVGPFVLPPVFFSKATPSSSYKPFKNSKLSQYNAYFKIMLWPLFLLRCSYIVSCELEVIQYRHGCVIMDKMSLNLLCAGTVNEVPVCDSCFKLVSSYIQLGGKCCTVWMKKMHGSIISQTPHILHQSAMSERICVRDAVTLMCL